MTDEFLMYVVAGFAAQLVDGALGMAYGVSASSMLLGFGLPPATVSATVHAAECFTTGASGLSHWRFGNIDKALFKKLLLPAMAGGAIGAFILSSLPGEAMRPWVALYLMIMGGVIMFRGLVRVPPRQVKTKIIPLGFFAALIDALGGGGWGPITASTLIARGQDVRYAVGSINAAEFFVTLSVSLTFLMTIGFSHGHIILGLALGGFIAAPFGAWLCRRVPARPFMLAVGAVIIGLSLYNLWKAIG